MLDIQDLHVRFLGREREAVAGVSLSIGEGEIVGLVGESGSGKTVTAMSVAGLLPRKQCDYSGKILLDGTDLLHADRESLRKIQGRDIGVVFQEPQTSLDPLMKIGPQVEEVLRIHTRLDRAERRRLAVEAMAAVEAGASQVQGTYIGFGERCGNTNLSTIIPNLQMKKGYRCIPEDKLVRLGKTARYIAQVTNLVLSPNMPYVGRSAFAHKGGMHVDGVAKNTLSFEHITPESVGNRRQILLSEFAGRTAIAGKIAALDSSITRDSQVTAELIEKLKGLEYQGFAFESAAASFELFALKQLGKYRPAFDLEYFKTLGEQPAVNVERCCSAIVKVRVGESIEMTSAEGDGPVHALDIALRKALEVFYPCLSQVRLIDYKVRVMEGHRATAAIVRVLIESTDGVSTWTTVGCSADIIDASWQALRDSMEYKLMKDGAVSGPVA